MCNELHNIAASKLPTASVVVVESNEATCALRRMMHSLLDRSPRAPRTTVLLDDGSSWPIDAQMTDEVAAQLSEVALQALVVS